MPETLLTPSSIKLFGRIMRGISIDSSSLGLASYLGGNNFLRQQLSGGNIILSGNVTAGSANVPVNLPLDVGLSLASDTNPNNVLNISDGDSNGTVIDEESTCTVTVSGGVVTLVLTDSASALKTAKNTPLILQAGSPPKFARIYSFSFEGAFYTLPRPSIFLVHGYGQWAGDWTTNSSLDQAGVAGKDWDFSGTLASAGPDDVYYWEYEKGDFSLRLDAETGPFEQILLAATLRGGADMADRSGQGLGIRSGQGLDARSGQGLDIRSGQGLRR
jgi:hypothetical protein